MYNSLRNLGIYNEFGDMTPNNAAMMNNPQAQQAAAMSAFQKQMNVVTNLFKAIVNTIKDKWAKFMAMIDDNMAKLKNRIDVANGSSKANIIKQAFFKMQQVKKFENPMKRVLMKANMIFAKTKNAKDIEAVAQAKEQLKQERITQKNIIKKAKLTLEESKKLLGKNQ